MKTWSVAIGVASLMALGRAATGIPAADVAERDIERRHGRDDLGDAGEVVGGQRGNGHEWEEQRDVCRRPRSSAGDLARPDRLERCRQPDRDDDPGTALGLDRRHHVRTILEVPLASSLPRPAGLIFDLDGTLVDTVSARIDGWVEALTAVGIPATAAQVAPKIGMDGRRLAREVASDDGRELTDHEVEEIDKAAGEGFDRRNGSPKTLPGVHALLESLSDQGLPWVIATSSRAAQVKNSVAALELGHEPKIVDGSHVKHAKPAPDLLLLAAKQFGAAPERCWAVGDATWDVRAAVAGGITAVGVLAGSAVSREALLDAGAAAVIESLEELPALLGD